jgi:PPM family protein phosphatase
MIDFRNEFPSKNNTNNAENSHNSPFHQAASGDRANAVMADQGRPPCTLGATPGTPLPAPMGSDGATVQQGGPLTSDEGIRPMGWPGSMVGLASNRGRRPYMEDAAAALRISHQESGADPLECTILTVCDGVGGQMGGAAASDLGIRIVTQELSRAVNASVLAGMVPDDLAGILATAITLANDRIAQLARLESALSDMATTIVSALMVGDMLVVAWAGDSRAYLWRDGDIRRLTTDHALGNHVISQCLGMAAGVTPDFQVIELRTGDVVILVTDGVTDALDDQVIGTLLASSGDAQAAAHAVIDAALSAGTTDNVTAVCAIHHPAPRPGCDPTSSALAQSANL